MQLATSWPYLVFLWDGSIKMLSLECNEQIAWGGMKSHIVSKQLMLSVVWKKWKNKTFSCIIRTAKIKLLIPKGWQCKITVLNLFCCPVSILGSARSAISLQQLWCSVGVYMAESEVLATTEWAEIYTCKIPWKAMLVKPYLSGH